MTKSITTVGLLTMLVGCAAEDDPSSLSLGTESRTAALSAQAAVEPAIPNRCPSDLPPALNPAPDATLVTWLAAKGVQIYTCASAAGAAPVWTLKAPHAVLGRGGDIGAIHFAGPSWQALDGSLVTGARLASAPSPDPDAIPWLLLRATPTAAPGMFSDTTTIQRLSTAGGLAPLTGCDAAHLGAEVLVPYQADYFFYKTAAPGTRIRQCHSI